MIINVFSILSYILYISTISPEFTDWNLIFETISKNNIQMIQKDNTRSFKLVWTDYLLLLHNNGLKVYDQKKRRIFNWITIFDKNKIFPTLENKESNWNKLISIGIQNWTLFTTIVDTNGGWSIEWIETVLELCKNGKRYISKCFDYNNYGLFENNENKAFNHSMITSRIVFKG